MFKKYWVTNIQYDTDDEEVDLPEEFVFTINVEDIDNFDIGDLLGDYIADETGFCVYGFNYEEIEEE